MTVYISRGDFTDDEAYEKYRKLSIDCTRALEEVKALNHLLEGKNKFTHKIITENQKLKTENENLRQELVQSKIQSKQLKEKIESELKSLIEQRSDVIDSIRLAENDMSKLTHGTLEYEESREDLSIKIQKFQQLLKDDTK
jgi:regulator of replication initiation timing